MPRCASVVLLDLCRVDFLMLDSMLNNVVTLSSLTVLIVLVVNQSNVQSSVMTSQHCLLSSRRDKHDIKGLIIYGKCNVNLPCVYNLYCCCGLNTGLQFKSNFVKKIIYQLN